MSWFKDAFSTLTAPVRDIPGFTDVRRDVHQFLNRRVLGGAHLGQDATTPGGVAGWIPKVTPKLHTTASTGAGSAPGLQGDAVDETKGQEGFAPLDPFRAQGLSEAPFSMTPRSAMQPNPSDELLRQLEGQRVQYIRNAIQSIYRR